jgi:integrase
MPIKLVRRPKSPNWVMRGTVRRIRIEESAGTSDRRLAEEIRAKREAELLAQSVYGRRATATFAEAAVSYLENGGSCRFIEPVIRYFGTLALAQIDQDALDRGARKLFPNTTPSTRNRHFFTPASAVLHHAARRGWCSRPIIDRPEVGPDRIRWLTIDEADRLIESAADHLKPLLIFLLYTGARVGEALWLDWRDVDLSRAHVAFPNTKNGEPRGVPLHQRVVVALANLKHRDGEVFRRPDARAYERPKHGDDHSAGARISTAFGGACRRAGIVNFHPHDCRHTWATWHYAANRDLGALMRLGGWKSVRMVMRYAHVNVAELTHTINALPGGKFGETPKQKEKSK